MNSLLVIDNFLQDPDYVRKIALSYPYFNNQENDSTFPGKRTNLLTQINPNYNKFLFSKFTTLLFNLEQSSYTVDIKSYFQLINDNFIRGWVHSDDLEVDIAGVLYLTPEAPKNSGTEFYIPKENTKINSYVEIKKSFVMGKTTKEEAFSALKQNNAQYELTDFIANKYNRLILYPAHWLHCAGTYFGSTDEDSRLTQVFFIKCMSHNSNIKYFMDKVRYT
jgi:hypothetical protein